VRTGDDWHCAHRERRSSAPLLLCSSAPLLLCSSAPLLPCSPALLHMLTRKGLGSPHPPSHACRPAAHLVMERSGLTDVVLMPLDVTTSLVCTERLTEQVVGRKLMRDSGGGGSGDDAERPWTRPYDASSRGCKLFYRDLSDFMCETNMAFKETGGACGFLVHSPPPPHRLLRQVGCVGCGARRVHIHTPSSIDAAVIVRARSAQPFFFVFTQ
jgi:hypothetical protein